VLDQLERLRDGVENAAVRFPEVASGESNADLVRDLFEKLVRGNQPGFILDDQRG